MKRRSRDGERHDVTARRNCREGWLGATLLRARALAVAQRAEPCRIEVYAEPDTQQLDSWPRRDLVAGRLPSAIAAIAHTTIAQPAPQACRARVDRRACM